MSNPNRIGGSVWLVLLLALLLVSVQPTAALAVSVAGELATEIAIAIDASNETAWQNRLFLQIDEPVGAFDVIASVEAKQGTIHREGSLAVSEATLIWYGDRAKLQVGRSILNWGTAMKLNPTNIINPIDVTDPEFGRLPVQLAALSYYPANEWELTAVWLPEFAPVIRSIPGSPQIPVELPGNALEDTQAAARILYRGSGFDLSLIGSYGWDSFPHVVPTPEGPKARFKRSTRAGIGYASSIGDIGIWSEGIVSFDEDNQTAQEVVVGGDYRLGSGVYVLGQVRWLDDGSDQAVLFMGGVEGIFASIHAWSLGILADPKNETISLRPAIELSLADGLAVTVGGTLVQGDGQLPGHSAGKKRLDVMLKASF